MRVPARVVLQSFRGGGGELVELAGVAAPDTALRQLFF
jgi:hypothetical protein